MNSSKNYAQRELGISETDTKGVYNNSIFTVTSNLVKKNYERFSRSFWIANFRLEENRRDHADLGHLWRQISYCLALLVFRLVGRVVR